jgi:hypothetical protein
MQNVYNQYMTAGEAGLLADTGFTDKVSYAAEGAVPFGAAIALGTNPERQGKVAASGAAVIGIAIRAANLEQPVGGGAPSYADKSMVSVLKRGRIWVKTNDAVAAGSTANLVLANGTFTDASVAAGIEALTQVSVKFVTGTTAAGLAIVEVNPK